MKKRIIIYAFLFILILSSIKVSIAQEDPLDVAQVISNEFNISKDKIPTDPEQIKQLYLKERWTKVISNSTYFGPIHKGLTKLNDYYIFKVFLNYNYEVSFKFFVILFVWFLLFFEIGGIVKSSGFIKGDWELPYFVGMTITVIIAQLKVINIWVTSILDLIFKQENWWWRSIIIVIVFGIFAVLHVISKMAEKKMKEKKKAKIEKEKELELKKLKNITKEAHDIYNMSDVD